MRRPGEIQIAWCFGGGGSSAPAPTPAAPPPPPSKMDEGAAGRQASVDQIRASQASGFQSTVGPSGLGGLDSTTRTTKTLLGA
jgi:hypothetical protein